MTTRGLTGVFPEKGKNVRKKNVSHNLGRNCNLKTGLDKNSESKVQSSLELNLMDSRVLKFECTDSSLLDPSLPRTL